MTLLLLFVLGGQPLHPQSGLADHAWIPSRLAVFGHLASVPLIGEAQP